MKPVLPARLEEARERVGPMASDASDGANGRFHLQGPCGAKLMIFASDGGGWEHVSVSTQKRCPNWTEMGFVKDLFWEGDELVVQMHPPKREYVNNHPYCLHLWRNVAIDYPTPPSVLVGDKQAGPMTNAERATLWIERNAGGDAFLLSKI